ncbi:cobalt-precorrin-5B (C(1))-methyltransferase CbiD [Synergistaceae bacterium OttesenSCG-928-I11]|nr:cobalt-precorrin-5B (C(1))-methyltransferase CbiD [Synergistaceae bacterium OttesenSCG-928-I11]
MGEVRDGKGFSTAAAAVAASVAALRFLQGKGCAEIDLVLQGGAVVQVPITGCLRMESGADAWVTKDAGDDPDVTHGAVIVSSVKPTKEPGITILGGRGIGVVTKPGLLVAPGKVAINPGPMALIRRSVEEELPQGMGATVTISIPNGEELAKRTYNPRLGIVGGLSILDAPYTPSTLDSDSIVDAIKSKLSALEAAGARTVCLVPGNYGRRMAIILGVPDDRIVNISNFAGDALTIASNLGFEKLILIGQVGKFAKLSAGSFDTHNARSGGRLEAIAAYSALHGACSDEVREILEGTMADEVATRISRTDWGKAALKELTDRIVKTAMSTATGISECACMTFSLPDRELSRTENLEALIAEIKNDGKQREKKRERQ